MLIFWQRLNTGNRLSMIGNNDSYSVYDDTLINVYLQSKGYETMNDNPVLDSVSALHIMGDDREIYDEVLETYLEVTPDVFHSLEDAVHADDRVTLKRYAHSLKSSSQTIGGMKIGASALQLEKNAETMDKASVLQHITLLKQLYDELIGALKNEGFI